MKTYRILFLLMIAVGLLSCEKNVLDKQPLEEIGEDLVWSDVKLANLYLNDVYLNLPGGLWRNLDCATDLGDDGHEWAPAQSWNTGDVNPFNDSFDAWASSYSQIRKTNLVLENAAKLKGEPTAIDQLKGQAYFLRAYFYSVLINFYGGVPIIDKAQVIGDSLSVSRNTYDECLNFILADIDKAVALLPESWEGADVGRATKGAALALKSRELLFAASPLHNPSNDMSKWQKAADAAKAIIDMGIYSLYPDYYKLFHVDNNEEVIFDIQYGYPTRTQNIEYRTNPQGFGGSYGMTRPSEDLVECYEMSSGKSIFDPTSGYDLQNPYVDRDPRFYASILYNGSPWRGKILETYVDGLSGPGAQDQYATSVSMTGYYSRKFITETNINAYTIDKSQENWILMRYAEVLLNYAEAELNLGNESEAKTYMNMIRARAGMPEIPSSETGEELMARYRNERKIELSFEEIHFFDVRRWMVGPEEVGTPIHKMHIIDNGDGTFTFDVEEMEDRAWRDAFYYLPIPGDERQKNKNLDQNPGW